MEQSRFSDSFLLLWKQGQVVQTAKSQGRNLDCENVRSLLSTPLISSYKKKPLLMHIGHGYCKQWSSNSYSFIWCISVPPFCQCMKWFPIDNKPGTIISFQDPCLVFDPFWSIYSCLCSDVPVAFYFFKMRLKSAKHCFALWPLFQSYVDISNWIKHSIKCQKWHWSTLALKCHKTDE